METKKKLELKDICGYLPYGLEVGIFGEGIDDNEITLIGGIDKKTYLDTTNDVCKELWDVDVEGVKPILRPLSDLYRTITHDGKEIVPIVECAKLTHFDYSWKFDGKYNAISYNENVFEFDSSRGFSVDEEPAQFQYRLFDFLHELKIDYRGLIDGGVAVSVYDIENNPYK